MTSNVVVGQFPPDLCDYFNDGRPKRTYALYGSEAGPMTQHSRAVKFDLMRKGFFGNAFGAVATACTPCQACVSIRINTDKFKLNRNARKTLNKGDYSFQIQATETVPILSLFDVFNRYQNARHNEPTSEMRSWSLPMFKGWVQTPTSLLVAKDRGKVIGFSLVDAHEEALSLEYSAFDPDYGRHSLGTQLWLQTAIKAKAYDFEHVYVGPWAKGSPKLGYKENFKGLEAFIDNEWVDFDPAKHTTGADYKALMAQHANFTI